MKNQAQLKTAIRLLRNNTHNARQAKLPKLSRAGSPPYKLTFALVITALALSAADAWAKPDAAWNFTGSMSVGRFVFTATTLQNGKVLVAGGATSTSNNTNRADLYNPATGTFTPTGSMHDARVGFSATRLPNGKVLVEGGVNNTVRVKTAEIYDPATGTWSITASMKQPREAHSAILLRDGTVLVSGGNMDRTPCSGDPNGCVTTLATSEIYNPSTGQWKSAGEMTIPRSFHTTTLLANGKVLATGGRIHTGPDYFDLKAIADADLYDPATGKWSATGTMTTSRTDHSASLLPNGQVLVAGGETVDINGVTVASAELYNPLTGSWTATGNMLQSRERFTANVLQNGQVLVAGGDFYDGVNFGALSECELYDPALGTWSATASMSTSRFGARSALLRDGRMLEAGGDTDANFIPTATAELYTP